MLHFFSCQKTIEQLSVVGYFSKPSPLQRQTEEKSEQQELIHADWKLQELRRKRIALLSCLFSLLPLLIDAGILVAAYYLGERYKRRRTFSIFPDFSLVVLFALRILMQGINNQHNKKEAVAIYWQRIDALFGDCSDFPSFSCLFSYLNIFACGFLPLPPRFLPDEPTPRDFFLNELTEIETPDPFFVYLPEISYLNRKYVVMEGVNFVLVISAFVAMFFAGLQEKAPYDLAKRLTILVTTVLINALVCSYMILLRKRLQIFSEIQKNREWIVESNL